MKFGRIPYLLVAILVIATMFLAACQPKATEAPPAVVEEEAPPPEPTEPPPPEPTEPPPPPEPTEVPEPELGSMDRPIKVLFVPSVEADVIVSGGEVMADALKEATGMEFEVMVPTSYAATIEEMCASPADTMGFIPGLGYVLANQLCGVDVSFAAVRYGSAVYWAQIIVARDSEFQTLEDLNGASWGLTDPGSTSGYMTPLAMFQSEGIEVGEMV